MKRPLKAIVKYFSLIVLSILLLSGAMLSLLHLVKAAGPEEAAVTLAEPQATTAQAGQAVTLTHRLSYTGPDPLPAVFTLTALSSAWSAGWLPLTTTLSPGQTAAVTVSLTVPTTASDYALNALTLTVSGPAGSQDRLIDTITVAPTPQLISNPILSEGVQLDPLTLTLGSAIVWSNQTTQTQALVPNCAALPPDDPPPDDPPPDDPPPDDPPPDDPPPDDPPPDDPPPDDPPPDDPPPDDPPPVEHKLYLPLIFKPGGSLLLLDQSPRTLQSSDLLSATLTPGEAYTYTFTAPGSFSYCVSSSPGQTNTVIVPAGPSGDFRLAGQPAEQTVIQGQPAQVTAHLNALYGFSDPVNLALLGMAGSAQFNPPLVVSPTSRTQLTLTPTVSVPPGRYPLTLLAQAGDLSRTVPLSLTVLEDTGPNFTISLIPLTQTVYLTQETSYLVKLTALNGFLAPVVLTVTQVPTGAQAEIVLPPSWPEGRTVLTVTTRAGVPLGPHAVTIRASGGQRSHAATSLLNVTDNISDALAAGPKHCEVLPIVVQENIVYQDPPTNTIVRPVGDDIETRQGGGSGNFAFITWPMTVSQLPWINANPYSESYLWFAFTYPWLSQVDYINPNDAADTTLDIGDWVKGSTGQIAGRTTIEAVEAKIGQLVRLPIWDTVDGAGQYRASGFIKLQVTNVDFHGTPKTIYGEFMGLDNECGY